MESINTVRVLKLMFLWKVNLYHSRLIQQTTNWWYLSYFSNRIWHFMQLASMAQLDARLTGDQDFAGSTPARSATFFRGDWS